MFSTCTFIISKGCQHCSFIAGYVSCIQQIQSGSKNTILRRYPSRDFFNSEYSSSYLTLKSQPGILTLTFDNILLISYYYTLLAVYHYHCARLCYYSLYIFQIRRHVLVIKPFMSRYWSYSKSFIKS